MPAPHHNQVVYTSLSCDLPFMPKKLSIRTRATSQSSINMAHSHFATASAGPKESVAHIRHKGACLMGLRDGLRNVVPHEAIGEGLAANQARVHRPPAEQEGNVVDVDQLKPRRPNQPPAQRKLPLQQCSMRRQSMSVLSRPSAPSKMAREASNSSK